MFGSLRVLRVLQVLGRCVVVLGLSGMCLKVLGTSRGSFCASHCCLQGSCGGCVWRADLWLAAGMALVLSCSSWRALRSASDPVLGFGGWGRPVRMAHLHVRRCVVGVCSPLREAVGRVACAPGSRLFVAHPQSTCVLNASGVLPGVIRRFPRLFSVSCPCFLSCRPC